MNILNQKFTYRLRVRNATGRDFVYETGELRQGRWYRDGTDNRPPIGVPAGVEREVLGIWMPPSGKSGYECRCVWADDASPEQKTGGFALTLSVPFLMGKNAAGLDVHGPYRIEGWTGLPKIGREFSHTLTIRGSS